MVKKLIVLVGCIGVSLLAGFIGSFFTMSEIPTWYAGLEKPFFNPPNWVFGPVWTLLYILMGTSLYLVVSTAVKKKEKVHARTVAVTLFFIQLILNFAWSIIFFGLHQIGVAFLEILVLLVVLILTMVYTKRISKTGAYLLIPYIAWVSFATILNFSVFVLNR